MKWTEDVIKVIGIARQGLGSNWGSSVFTGGHLMVVLKVLVYLSSRVNN